MPSAPSQHRSTVAALLQRHSRRTLALLLALFAVIVCIQAGVKLFWFDELVTLHIAQLGSPRAIWQALALGTDPNPPFTHLAVLASTTLFGLSTLAVRLPSILAVLAALIALWVFLRRRLPVLWTAAGLLFFMTTRGFDFAYDARSYALLLGTSMAALTLWTIAIDHPRNWLAPAGIALALALGLSSNQSSPTLTVIAPDDPNNLLLRKLAADRVTLTPQPRSSHWDQLGGVFTSLAHDNARIFTSSGIINP